MFKIVVLGILVYMFYRVAKPADKKIENPVNRAPDDEEYVDYEEID